MIDVEVQLSKEDLLVEVIVKNGRKKMIVACSTDIDSMGRIAQFLVSAFSASYTEGMKASHKTAIEVIEGMRHGTNDISK